MAALAVVYALGIVIWQLLRETPLAGWWVYELIDIFGAWFYAPLPVLLFPGLLRRQTRSIAFLSLPLLAFLLEYGWVLSPRGNTADGPSLRVMTANLLYVNDDFDSFEQALAVEQPDVLAIQELEPGIADLIQARLRDRFPYQALFPTNDPLGSGILSRYPIVDAPPPPTGADRCYCHRASIEFAQTTIVLVNVHPLPPTFEFRRIGPLPLLTGFRMPTQQIVVRSTIGFGRDESGPLLVAGDFNLGDRQPGYREITQQLRDAYRVAGSGFGFSYPTSVPSAPSMPVWPLVRIDYIFHNDRWVARDSWTGHARGSDHRYVVADLVLRH